MSILKDTAQAVRSLAQQIEKTAAELPKTAKDLIRQYLPANCLLKYQQRVYLELARDPEFVERTIKDAGLALGVEIGKTLAAAYKGVQKEPQPNSMFIPSYDPCDQAVYEAEVVVLTRSQLENVVQRALELGAHSY